MSANLFSCRRGTAAVEMALVAPMLLALLFGSVELGNYFRSEHVLLKGVRDGAIYAARQEIPVNYDCSGGTPTVPAGVVTQTKTLVRTGALGGGSDLLPKWDDASTTFTITVSCVTAAGGTTMSGLYLSNGGKVPVLTVAADLPYNSVLGMIGLRLTGLRVHAQEQTAAYGG